MDSPDALCTELKPDCALHVQGDPVVWKRYGRTKNHMAWNERGMKQEALSAARLRHLSLYIYHWLCPLDDTHGRIGSALSLRWSSSPSCPQSDSDSRQDSDLAKTWKDCAVQTMLCLCSKSGNAYKLLLWIIFSTRQISISSCLLPFSLPNMHLGTKRLNPQMNAPRGYRV